MSSNPNAVVRTERILNQLGVRAEKEGSQVADKYVLIVNTWCLDNTSYYIVHSVWIYHLQTWSAGIDHGNSAFV